MKKLSARQEMRIIRSFLDGRHEILDSGSSRILLTDPDDSRYVWKLAVGPGGIHQNAQERRITELYPEYTPEMTHYGRFIVRVEKVRPIWNEEWDEDYLQSQGIEDPEEEFAELIDFGLMTVFGESHEGGFSSDALQIGVTSDGRYVSFDVGYNGDASHIGYASDYSYRRDLPRYINAVLNLLRLKRPPTEITSFC